MSQATINLVADIGGTNIRLGIARANGEVNELTVYQCREFNSLQAVVRHYIEENHISNNTINACFAIACPVDKDIIQMTNLPWKFSVSEIKQELKLNKLLLINDYTAIAYAVPYLNDEQKIQIGEGSVIANKPISICGPGTGLGVSNVVPVNDNWYAISGEGGHVDFAPIDAIEVQVFEYLDKKYSHVSYEQLLSGLGIEQIYQALNEIHQSGLPTRSANQISELGLSGDCRICHQTLLQFCKILGSFAGNLALTMSSFGGVYIAGGIVPRFIEFFKQSEFRSRFESKGRLSSFNHTIPTFVITESQPGILGASAYLRQHNKEEL
ncbi:glucokinase [Thalassotalea hakodatensis]|uniref:glucokinase n=1 Tax=Thalassotalea hakodatensis TaxID=3030492 RepID=UPI002572DF77|nr:glucokinase [Thalassotalea hakodatensis]